jgi:hypothetical protein
MPIKKLLIIIIALAVIGGGAFYGGMKYGQSKSPARQNFQNLSQEQRQQLLQGGTQRGAGAGFLTGEVIAKDEQSLTLKMSDGSSKIVFFSDSTQISKTTEGSISDIEIGKQIMVSGSQNSDGSYTAKTIQLSPLHSTPTQ